MNFRVPDALTAASPTANVPASPARTWSPRGAPAPAAQATLTLAQRTPEMVTRGQRYTTLAAVALFRCV